LRPLGQAGLMGGAARHVDPQRQLLHVPSLLVITQRNWRRGEEDVPDIR
jgi:hypothetical protein